MWHFTRWSLHFLRKLNVLEATHSPLTFKFENTFFCSTELPESPPENAFVTSSMFLSSSYFPKLLTCFFPDLTMLPLLLFSLETPTASPTEAIHPPTVHFLPIFINKLCLKYSGYHCWNILYFSYRNPLS